MQAACPRWQGWCWILGFVTFWLGRDAPKEQPRLRCLRRSTSSSSPVAAASDSGRSAARHGPNSFCHFSVRNPVRGDLGTVGRACCRGAHSHSHECDQEAAVRLLAPEIPRENIIASLQNAIPPRLSLLGRLDCSARGQCDDDRASRRSSH